MIYTVMWKGQLVRINPKNRTAEIGMMEADLAAKIMYADADAETINEKAKEFGTFS